MALLDCSANLEENGRELLEYRTAPFPIGCYYIDFSKHVAPWHWHEELEAAVIIKGSVIVNIEKETRTLKVGEGFFVNGSALHTISKATSSGCLLHSITFHPRLISGDMDSIFWQKYTRPILSNKSFKGFYFDGMASWHTQAFDFIESAWQAAEREPIGYEFQVRSDLSQLVLLLYIHQPVLQKEPSERELRDALRIRTMLQHIQEHYMEEMDVAQIARSAMVSESECLRCFHKNIGIPPIRYMKQFRIQKAAELLVSTEKKIGDIGAECGFLDTSYFTKVFREIKGCTPGAYRSGQKV